MSLSRILVPALVMALGACDGKSPTGTDRAPAQPTSLAFVVAPPASARSGVPFPSSPVVELRDAANQPVARAGVAVHVAVDDGSVALDSMAFTGSDGRATFTRMEMAGPAAIHRVTFSASDLQPVSASVRLLAGPPARLLVAFGEPQWAEPGTPVQLPPAVRVVDGAGNPVAGTTIRFAPVDGSGTVEHATATTDMEGLGNPGQWTLGTTVGRQHLVARLDTAGVEPLTLTVVGLPESLRFERLATSDDDGMCALTADGAGWCWGRDDFGQLGDSASPPNVVPMVRPVPIAGGLHLTSVSGGAYACGLAEGGAVYCWGHEPIVNGVSTWTPETMSAPPLTATTTGGWGGYVFGCGLYASGTAYCWGDNFQGVLGTGDMLSHEVPTAVAGGHHFTTIAAGADHVCALTAEGAAYCWGRTRVDGELDLTPATVPGGLTFASISASVATTCGVTRDGKGYCWGFGEDGRLGDGQSHDAAEPSAVAGDITFASISAGAGESCGLATDGSAWCWGGAFPGDGAQHRTLVPVRVSSTRTFRALTTTTAGACALATDGQPYCWGGNQYGQVGNGTTLPALVPVPVVGQD